MGLQFRIADPDERERLEAAFADPTAMKWATAMRRHNGGLLVDWLKVYYAPNKLTNQEPTA